MPVQNTETAISILYIMGIFPGAFISRKMSILTFSRVFFPGPHMAALILNLAVKLLSVLAAECVSADDRFCVPNAR